MVHFVLEALRGIRDIFSIWVIHSNLGYYTIRAPDNVIQSPPSPHQLAFNPQSSSLLLLPDSLSPSSSDSASEELLLELDDSAAPAPSGAISISSSSSDSLSLLLSSDPLSPDSDSDELLLSSSPIAVRTLRNLRRFAGC